MAARRTRQPAVVLGGALALLALAAAPAAAQLPAYDCNAPYAVNPSDLLVDFDINCGLNFTQRKPNMDMNWTSRWGGLWTNYSLPNSARSLDTTRNLYRGVISANRKITIPVDISPSVLPAASVEYLVSIGSASANAAFKCLWHTDTVANAALSGPHGRGLLTYESAGSGSYIVPHGSTAFTDGRMGIGSGWIHVVVSYNLTHAAWYLNGVFAQVRATASANMMPNITLGGVWGTTTYDHGSQTFAYIRVWKRALSQADAIKLAMSPGATFLNYTRPLVINKYPVYVFNPSPTGSGSASASFTTNIACSQTERLYPNGTLLTVATGTVSSVTSSLLGNYTYRLTMGTSLVPSSTYGVKFSLPSLVPILQGVLPDVVAGAHPAATPLCYFPVSTTINAVSGCAALSPVMTTTAGTTTKMRSDRLGSPVRLCLQHAWNRPFVNLTIDGDGVTVTNMNVPLTSFSGLYSPDPNVVMTRLDDSNKLFQICWNAAPARPATVSSLQFPVVPTLTNTDADGIPAFGGPWSSPSISVIRGLYANITVASADTGVGTVTFNVSWNIAPRASSFNASADAWCGNCAGLTAAPTDANATNPRDFLVTVTAADASLPVALGLNSTLSAADPTFAWNTAVDVAYSCASYSLASGVSTSGDPAPCANVAPVGPNTPVVGGSVTSTPSMTPTASMTPSLTPSVSASASVTPSATLTPSPTGTVVHTESGTPTPSSSSSVTATATVSPSASGDATPTPSVTGSQTATPSAAGTGTPTTTATGSATFTPSATPSTGASPSASETPSATGSPTPTGSETSSATGTGTSTGSSTPSGTGSTTPTVSATKTPGASPSGSGTSTDSPTPTGSETPSGTASKTPSPTSTGSSTVAVPASPTCTPSTSPSRSRASSGTSDTGTGTATTSATLTPSQSPGAVIPLTPSATSSLAFRRPEVVARLTLPGCDASAPARFRDSAGPACTLRDLLASTAGVKPGNVIFTDVCCVLPGASGTAAGQYCISLDADHPANKLPAEGCDAATARRLLRALQAASASLPAENLRVSSRIQAPATKAELLALANTVGEAPTASDATDACATCTTASAVIAARLAALSTPPASGAANITQLLGRVASSWAVATGYNATAVAAAVVAAVTGSVQAVASGYTDAVPPNYAPATTTIIAVIVVMAAIAVLAVLTVTGCGGCACAKRTRSQAPGQVGLDVAPVTLCQPSS